MKHYRELSDDALIDFLITKAKTARGMRLGVESGEPHVVSRAGRKQDGDVSTAEFAGRAHRPIKAPRVHPSNPPQDFQGDFLANLDLGDKPEPRPARNDVPSDADPEVAARGPERCVNKESGQVEDVRPIALTLVRDEHRLPGRARPLRDQPRKQLLGDPARRSRVVIGSC